MYYLTLQNQEPKESKQIRTHTRLGARGSGLVITCPACFFHRGLCEGLMWWSYFKCVCVWLLCPEEKKRYPAYQRTSVRIFVLLSCLLRLSHRSEHHSVAPLSSALSLGFHQLAGLLLLLLLAAAGMCPIQRNRTRLILSGANASPLSTSFRRPTGTSGRSTPTGGLGGQARRWKEEERARPGCPVLFLCLVARRALLLLPPTTLFSP